MNVEIIDRPELRLAGIPHVGPYNQIGPAFRQLGAIAGPAGLFHQPGAAMIALFHDDPRHTPPDRLRSDAAIVIADGAPLPAGLTEQRVPAGRYARTTHVGPYERLSEVWGQFRGEWLPASGHQITAGASYELYRNDPSQVGPEELLTDLYVPVA